MTDRRLAALDHSNVQIVAATLAAYARRNGSIVEAFSHDDMVIDTADDEVRLVKV